MGDTLLPFVSSNAEDDEIESSSSQETRWRDFIDSTLNDLAQTRAIRDFWTPVRDYLRETVDRLSFLLTCLLGLQVFLVVVILADFLLNLRSVFVVHG